MRSGETVRLRPSPWPTQASTPRLPSTSHDGLRGPRSCRSSRLRRRCRTAPGIAFRLADVDRDASERLGELQPPRRDIADVDGEVAGRSAILAIASTPSPIGPAPAQKRLSTSSRMRAIRPSAWPPVPITSSSSVASAPLRSDGDGEEVGLVDDLERPVAAVGGEAHVVALGQALVGVAGQAAAARPAIVHEEHRAPRARRGPGPLARGDHRPRRLVAGDAFRSLVVLLAIGPADRVGLHRQQQLTRAGIRIFTIGKDDLPVADERRGAGCAWHRLSLASRSFEKHAAGPA